MTTYLPHPCPVDTFAVRARTAGHPVITAASGRWPHVDHFPHWSPFSPDGELAPNDLLDAARETARSQQGWVHAVLPSYGDAVRLAAAVQPTTDAPVPEQHAGSTRRSFLRRPSRGRTGDPRRMPFADLVAEVPLTVITLTGHYAGRPVHVVEIPEAWITRPLAPVAR